MRTKKGSANAPCLVSPFKLNMLTARYFFACGLNVVRGERIRPVPQEFSSKTLGMKHRKNPFSRSLIPLGLKMGLSAPPCLRRGPARRNRPPHAPLPGRVTFSYTRTSRRKCCTSCRCRCAPMCSYHIRRRLRLHSPASWPWCAHPSTRPLLTSPRLKCC